MRKTLLIICTFIVLTLSIQLVVFADMDGPGIEPYKATISNVNGAKYYDFQGVVAGEFKYGDVITVFYEIEDKEKKEVVAQISFSEDYLYNLYTVNLKDITPLENEAEKVTYSKTDKKEIKILNEDGVEISSGPAYAYEKKGIIIPKGEILTGYRSENRGGGIPWFYVTYKGTSGWVCELNGAIGYEKEYKDQKLLTPRKTNIYSDSNYTNVIKTIPANTMITDFLQIDPWSQGYYVNYQNVSGYISMGYCAVNFPWLNSEEDYLKYKVNYPEVKLYKEADTNSEVLIENIPEGTELKYYYAEDIRAVGWIYTSYENIDGWVFLVEDGFDYKEYLNDANKNTSIQEIEDLEDEEEYIENKISETQTENIVTNERVTEVSKQSGSTITSATQIVILCAMFGVTIAVTSIVTIALVNRKKKQD